MSLIRPLEDISAAERGNFGHKAWALGEMARKGFDVPPGVCIGADAYGAYIDSTALRERIELIVHRKRFQDMRWEELWDASLRVRNLFLTTPLPSPLRDGLASELESRLGHRAVAVRSSAPGEDSAAASFAGLHESYLNVCGADAILEHVRKVWASLWSDGTLAYRRESETDLATVSMAVIVQELIVGTPSGVAFGEAPDDPRHVVVESVHGLNEGLVDGSIEPDRWVLSREDGSVLRHNRARRDRKIVVASAGVRFETLSEEDVAAAPLRPDQLAQVFGLVCRVEALFGAPQDVEWTFAGPRLFVLQSRPITARPGDSPVDRTVDGRSWSSSLRKSLDYLLPLRKRVETALLPAMRHEVRTLGQRDLGSFSDEELAAEIRRRSDALRRWEQTYAKELIPLAHAIRLFGLFYNETVRPADPYEFLALLGATPMEGLRRNRMLEDLAAQVRADPALGRTLRNPPGIGTTLPEPFSRLLDSFVEDFGQLAWGQERCFADRQAVIRHILRLSEHPSGPSARPPPDVKDMGTRFLSRFQGDDSETATELLDLARASYRLRDDDNIVLGGIRSRVLEAAEEGIRRLSGRPWASRVVPSPEEAAQALLDPSFEPRVECRESDSGAEGEGARFRIRARQIVGQPAGPGLATGKARVVTARSDLFEFRSGEILVCDAIEPNMTFVVPLAAAVVERRGGMLIHGAIIAREYGLPCVTGIPEATASIHTGDTVTVDGHLGIVTVA